MCNPFSYFYLNKGLENNKRNKIADDNNFLPFSFWNENSTNNISTEFASNGGPSAPFNRDNSFLNRTIQRPKFYNIEYNHINNYNNNFRLAVPKICLKKPKKDSKKINYCVFCYNNKQPEQNYKNHVVKNEYGIVICPKLRLYECPICYQTGDNAHTIKYCPQKKIVTLEETLIMENSRSNKFRYNTIQNQCFDNVENLIKRIF